MRVLLLSTYELGHQPLHLAVPAARLRAAGHEVSALDLAVDRLDWELVAEADAIACSVPMHTAMVLAVEAARLIRDGGYSAPIAFFGLYAALGNDPTVGGLVDRIIAGEYSHPLLEWLDELASGTASTGETIIRINGPSPVVPDRSLLPALDRYAHLQIDGEHRTVGYVEATQGCGHTCRHCPIPAVYGGRFRAVDVNSIRSDVDQLVQMGASHITFGDPDFLNGPAHARRVLETISGDHPQLTYDVTVKVEHILDHADVWPDFARLGLIFVVSAYETVDDRTLRLMDKGHTASDLGPATSILRGAGVEVRPSLLPFTPWTELSHIPDLLEFLVEHDLTGSIDPIQLAIRLLIPEGSLMLGLPETALAITEYDASSLAYQWVSPDPVVDIMQARLAAVAEAGLEREDHAETLAEQWAVVREMSGTELAVAIPAGATTGRPRLTEPWFC